MKKPINFITVEGYYEKIVNSFIEPIRKHIKESSISTESKENAVNLHFFVEEHYQKQVKAEKGISVFMSHGLADKGWWKKELLNNYDYICVPGPLWKEKLLKEGIHEDKLLLVGYPKLDPLFQLKKEKNKELRILWAPTHNHSISSFPYFNEYLNKFPADIIIESSLHPQNKVNNTPTTTKLVNADVVIADSGSLLYEAWALGIPVVFPDWLVKDKLTLHYPKTIEAKIYRENIGYHATSFRHLIELIDEAKKNGIDHSAKNLIDQIFPPDFRGSSGKKTAEKLISF